MSGKICTNNGFVTKVDFMRLVAKVDSLQSKLSECRQEVRSAHQSTPLSPSVISNKSSSGGVKSWLYSKTGSRDPKIQRPSSVVNSTSQNCGKTDQYSDSSTHIFQKRGGSEEGFHDYDSQRCTKNEFNQFQADVSRDFKTLQKSVQEVQELYRNLEKSLNETLATLQASINNINMRMLAHIERIEQQNVQNNNTQRCMETRSKDKR
uniref:Uncharacterized protein n=1 Tax=Arion vulgaris TaxID=1028688 RepID=A0A0B7A677_9EUPU